MGCKNWDEDEEGKKSVCITYFGKLQMRVVSIVESARVRTQAQNLNTNPVEILGLNW